MPGLDDPEPRPVVVEMRRTERGELVLRRAAAHFEIILDGMFLMDTRDGRSERALVMTGIAGQRDVRVLLGGLGVGFSLDEALSHACVREVVVVEIEPEIVRWCGTYLHEHNGGCLGDPRVRLVLGDLMQQLRGSGERFDAICVDVDNGPDWLATPGNGEIYSEAGLREVARHLMPQGRLAVWSAKESPAFASRLRKVFRVVRRLAVPVERGPADVIYVAQAAAG